MFCSFQKACDLFKLSKMLMGNICNWLFQGASIMQKSLQDESGRGLISCMKKFFKPLDNIRRVSSLARETAL